MQRRYLPRPRGRHLQRGQRSRIGGSSWRTGEGGEGRLAGFLEGFSGILRATHHSLGWLTTWGRSGNPHTRN
jgi:hypothetical protein